MIPSKAYTFPPTDNKIKSSEVNANFDALYAMFNPTLVGIIDENIATAAAIARTKIANTAIISTPTTAIGSQIITAAGAGYIAMIYKAGHATPTQPIIEVQTSAGAAVFQLYYNHYFRFGATNIYVRRNGDDLLFRDNNQAEVSLSTLAAAAGTDEKAKTSATDDTSDYLVNKLIGTALQVVVTKTGTPTETLVFSVPAINVTTGVTDADKIIKTDAGGYLDPTFLAAVMTIAGAKTWSGNQTFNAFVDIATATNWKLAGTAFAGTMGEINTLRAGQTSDADALHAHNQVIIPVTTGEAYSAGDSLYIKNSDGKAYKTDSDAVESTYGFIGFALDASTGVDETHYVLPPGSMLTTSGMTAGGEYVPGPTAGEIVDSASPGTYAMRYLMAISATKGLIWPSAKILGGTGTLTMHAGGGTPVTITCGFRPKLIMLISSVPVDMSSGSDLQGESVGMAWVLGSSIVQSCTGRSFSQADTRGYGKTDRFDGYVAYCYEAEGTTYYGRALVTSVTDTTFILTGRCSADDRTLTFTYIVIG